MARNPNMPAEQAGGGAATRGPAIQDGRDTRALAAQCRVRIARAHAAADALRIRLLASHQRLGSSLALLQESVPSPRGTLATRIRTLATSLEELHLRLVVELTALSDDLLGQLSAADEVLSLSDFCAHVLDTPDAESEDAERVR